MDNFDSLNSGQKLFYDFVMGRARPGKEDELRAVMGESFKRQGGGAFTAGYMDEIVPKLAVLLILFLFYH